MAVLIVVHCVLDVLRVHFQKVDVILVIVGMYFADPIGCHVTLAFDWDFAPVGKLETATFILLFRELGRRLGALNAQFLGRALHSAGDIHTITKEAVTWVLGAYHGGYNRAGMKAAAKCRLVQSIDHTKRKY